MVMARHWRQRFLEPRGTGAAVVVLAALATGCKTGSWGAKPSWWSFGGPAPAGSSLTAAPSFDADPTKPSAVAKPYPTTNTPEGYALDGSAQPAVAAATAPATVEPAAVTYGTTVAARAEQPEPSFQPGSPAAAATVGPQVGPYASLEQPAAVPPAANDPAAAAMAGFGAAPAFEAEPPPAAQSPIPTAPPAGTRVADARGSAAWPAATSPEAGGGDSRYGEVTGSRFGGGFAPASQPVGTAAAAPAFEPNPSLDPAPSLQPSPAMPAAMGTTPPLGQPTPPPAASALPGGLAPPTKRPDPGYRPGGTSSYRPNRAILADDESAVGPVQPVAYELPATAR